MIGNKIIVTYEEPEEIIQGINDMDSITGIGHDPKGLFYITFETYAPDFGKERNFHPHSLLDILKKWTIVENNLIRLEFHEKPNLPNEFTVPIKQFVGPNLLSFLKQHCAELENITQ